LLGCGIQEGKPVVACEDRERPSGFPGYIFDR